MSYLKGISSLRVAQALSEYIGGQVKVDVESKPTVGRSHDVSGEHLKQLDFDEERMFKIRKTPGMIFPRYIMNRILDNGVTLSIIYGELGAGKSTYALKVAYELLTYYGKYVMPGQYANYEKMDINQRYSFIHHHFLVFTIPQMLERIKKSRWKSRLPILIWDDAGVGGSNLLFFNNLAAYQALSGLIQTIRTRTGALLMTVPLTGLMAKQIRALPETVVVLVEKIDRETSRAMAFTQKQGVKRTYYILKFIDIFKRRLPDKYFEEYMEFRDSYVDYSIEQWEHAIRMAELRKMDAEERFKRKLEKRQVE